MKNKSLFSLIISALVVATTVCLVYSLTGRKTSNNEDVVATQKDMARKQESFFAKKSSLSQGNSVLSSNEIIEAFIKNKEFKDWTNLVYTAEAGRGDARSLRWLMRQGKTNHTAEVRAICSRIITNETYDSWYRWNAINSCSMLLNGDLDNNPVPSILMASQNKSDPLLRNISLTTLLLIYERPEVVACLPQIDQMISGDPKNEHLIELARKIRNYTKSW